MKIFIKNMTKIGINQFNKVKIQIYLIHKVNKKWKSIRVSVIQYFLHNIRWLNICKIKYIRLMIKSLV